jgi:AhpD family alkylhydroperoxidase
MTTEPRIAPGSRREIGLINSGLSWVGARATKTQSMNLFATMGRQRRMFKAWLVFGGSLMPGGKLPRRESELVILRVASRRACAYELEHHVRLGRRAGLTADEVDRVQQSEIGTQWGLRDSVLMRAADAIVDHKNVEDELWGLLRAHLSETEAVELTMLAAHYDMLATFIGTLRIQPDVRKA